ncbi:hypothetical protein GL2_25040 [Microbulbifer sp. GL-2]|nr:hypothetical protein GL2_25040 [Microbulbifer sp. GL-2]
MSPYRKIALLNVRLALLVLGVQISACTSHQYQSDLSADEFRKSFERDCQVISGIEELHSSTWYTVDETGEGTHTKESFSLEEMSGWLLACDRDPNNVSKIRK